MFFSSVVLSFLFRLRERMRVTRAASISTKWSAGFSKTLSSFDQTVPWHSSTVTFLSRHAPNTRRTTLNREKRSELQNSRTRVLNSRIRGQSDSRRREFRAPLGFPSPRISGCSSGRLNHRIIARPRVRVGFIDSATELSRTVDGISSAIARDFSRCVSLLFYLSRFIYHDTTRRSWTPDPGSEGCRGEGPLLWQSRGRSESPNSECARERGKTGRRDGIRRDKQRKKL